MYYSNQPNFGPNYTSYSGPSPVNNALAKLESNLNNEQSALLAKRGKTYNITPSVEDVLTMGCNHVKNGDYTFRYVYPNNTDIVQCTQCGTIIDLTAKFNVGTLKQGSKYFKDSFEFVKVRGNGIIPKEIQLSLSDALCLLDKFPKIYEIVEKSSKDFSKAQNTSNNYSNLNPDNIVNSVIGGGYNNMPPGMAQGPAYYNGVPYQPTANYNAPPAQQWAQQPMGNPFAGQQNVQYDPGMQLSQQNTQWNQQPQQNMQWNQQPQQNVQWAQPPQAPYAAQAPSQGQPQVVQQAEVNPQQPPQDNLVKIKKVFPD